MGYVTHARGNIMIDPPLSAAEMRKGAAFLPENACQSGRDQGRDVMYFIEVVEEETEEGVLRRQSGVTVVQTWDGEPCNYNIRKHLQEVIDLHPEHIFSGFFEMEGEESGDIWRLYAYEGRAVRVDPVITWPDPSEVADEAE